jgi:hypothetical protein
MLNGRYQIFAALPTSTPDRIIVPAPAEIVASYCLATSGGIKHTSHLTGTGLFALVGELADPEDPDQIRSLTRPHLDSVKHMVKDPGCFRRLEKLGLVVPDHSLVPWLFRIPENFQI